MLACIALIAPAAAFPLTAFGQPAANYDAVQIKITDLGHRTWMLQGQGGNMTAIVGDDGVILVDTEFAPLHDKIKAALAALSDKPVRYAVDTHLHGDYTGGNQAFRREGAVLVGQAELARSMAAGTINALTGAKTPPAPRAAIPTRTYDKAMTLPMRGRRVELVHMPHSHTKGDTAVWIPDANVLATATSSAAPAPATRPATISSV
jgi:glyoxylase-like metal-dependent hydrolase (beta-lactamase superfamily II)